MGIQVFNAGTASGTAGATIAITGVNVPVGSMIYIAVLEKNVTDGFNGSLADSAGNNYPNINGSSIQTLSNGRAMSFYAFNSKLLTNGTITYTKRISGVFTMMSAVYATGVLAIRDPLDQNTITNNFNSSSTPNSGSVFPQFNNELIIGANFWVAGVGDVFTQAPNWTSLPYTQIDSTGQAGIGAGYLINTGTSTVNYDTNIGNAHSWANFMQGFQPGIPPSDDVEFMAINY